MKVFLSTSFSSRVLPDGAVEAAYRQQIERILSSIEAKGHEVFCALREDGWKINDVSPKGAFELDVRNVQDCDIFLAILQHGPVSAGIEFEMGIAYALGKRIFMLSQASDTPVPYINRGMIDEGAAEAYTYHSLSDVPAIIMEKAFSF